LPDKIKPVGKQACRFFYWYF